MLMLLLTFTRRYFYAATLHADACQYVVSVAAAIASGVAALPLRYAAIALRDYHIFRLRMICSQLLFIRTCCSPLLFICFRHKPLHFRHAAAERPLFSLSLPMLAAIILLPMLPPILFPPLTPSFHAADAARAFRLFYAACRYHLLIISLTTPSAPCAAAIHAATSAAIGPYYFANIFSKRARRRFIIFFF